MENGFFKFWSIWLILQKKLVFSVKKEWRHSKETSRIYNRLEKQDNSLKCICWQLNSSKNETGDSQ